MRYFGNLDFNVRYCGIIQPCGMRFFILLWTVFGKRRSFTVLWYCSLCLSCLMWVNIWKTLDFTVNEYTVSDSYSMMKLVGHPMTRLFDRCTDQFKIFSRFLGKGEVDFCCIVTDHKCSIGISSIFDTVFRYLTIFRTLLLYWVPPNVPLSTGPRYGISSEYSWQS